MVDSHINKTKQYIESLTKTSSRWAEILEKYARENRVPIIDAPSMNLLLQLIRIHQPKRILEVGTAIAYSALRMHEIVPDAELITIEKNMDMYEKAQANINRYASKDSIKLVQGDALEVLSSFSLEERFDFVFIDAAKGQYEGYFKAIDPLVPKGGMIVSDNILFRNYLVSKGEDIPKRFKGLVKKLNIYNEKLMNHESYHSSIVPIGDGLLISVKI